MKKAAEAGDPKAQSELGKTYERGFNFAEAEYWYKKAAITGDPEVLLSLGRFYSGGKPKMSGLAPVQANPTNAIALISLAALQGYKPAIRDLALHNYSGTIIPRNKVRAYQLFRLSGSIMDKVHSDKLILELSTAVIEQAEADIKTFKPQRFQDVFPALVRSNLQLQGIAGTQKTLVAILNGKTVEVGKTILVEIATIPVQIRCLHIDKRSVAVGFLGEKQTLELP